MKSGEKKIGQNKVNYRIGHECNGTEWNRTKEIDQFLPKDCEPRLWPSYSSVNLFMVMILLKKMHWFKSAIICD